MSTSLTANRSTATSGSASEDPTTVSEPPTATTVRRRRPNLTRVLLFLLLMLLAGLAAVWVVSSVTDQNRVVMVTQPVAAGQTITAADLSEQTLGTIPVGVSTVPAEQMAGLVGQQALTDLTPGSLLPTGAVGDEPLPAAGRALVGLRLEQGRTIPDAQPGDNLSLVVTNPPNAAEPIEDPAADSKKEKKNAKPERTTYSAVVVKTTPAVDGAALLMTVDVSATAGADVAAFAADNRIAVVQEAR